jgi:hypothetical protein
MTAALAISIAFLNLEAVLDASLPWCRSRDRMVICSLPFSDQGVHSRLTH